MMGDSSIIAHFEEQAGWCEALGSPFTAALCRAMAKNFSEHGPIYELCKDWSGNPRKDALGLRIAGALHHAVLTEADIVLAAVYPAKRPDWKIETVWQIASNHIKSNFERVREFIQSAPQTNETRRSIALLPGFLELAARFKMPMDIIELGASAGLNLNWDRFNYQTDNWDRAGNSEVFIRTDWSGPPPRFLAAEPEIRCRSACDLNPLNVLDRDRALLLKAYTWPDQQERLSRLDAAIKLGVETGYHVQQANARDWLKEKIKARANDGLTVIYHSVFLIYPNETRLKIFSG